MSELQRQVRWGRQPWPLILGHRGAPRSKPENTLASFAEAIRLGVDGLELDVQLCKSGELCVFHDFELSRLTGRRGWVSDCSWDRMQSMRVGGEPIPRLEEVLDSVPLGKLLNIELKVSKWELGRSLVSEVIRCVRRMDRCEDVLLSSFHPAAYALARKLAPELRCSLIFASDQSRWLRRGWTGEVLQPFAVHPEHHLLTMRLIGRYRRLGWPIHTWTVDCPERAVWLAKLGVDAIITNEPEEISKALRPKVKAPPVDP